MNISITNSANNYRTNSSPAHSMFSVLLNNDRISQSYKGYQKDTGENREGYSGIDMLREGMSGM